MPCRIVRVPAELNAEALLCWLSGRKDPGNDISATVRAILAAVKKDGDKALRAYTRKFDAPDLPDRFQVPARDIKAALGSVPAADLDILREAIAHVRDFHARQAEQSWFTTSPDGTVLGQMVRPVDRVGLYVPGGQGGETPLISSLIMNAVPAQVAGVTDIAVISPPRKDSTLNPYILATAALLGVSEVHRAGSAWGIAALAYGTKSIRPVDVIAGPGNIYVATAKAILVGEVGIDMIAGPSEITILADDSADADYIAADMLSQAEHDPLAASLCITTSAQLAESIRTALASQLAKLPRRDLAARALKDWGGVLLVDSLDDGIALVNRIAPEHLELAVDEPFALLGKIRNAGAIFLGHHCPEPVGDYFAGPNHVLPTLGTARFSSALSVQSFCKKSSIIATSKDYITRNGGKIARLARLEGLEAHARSVEVRLEKNTK
ncbi:MAG TPA: histidinol dehydrogenase [Humidesulfovibrio sp.]|uniref:histidinol dehydrogenase n=1 Tax=Humidesulfovibrio sp. TaxID=2910988 RepID=UPI002C0B8E0A|nr:histidinol dehydrogenase [Humidesulfovibrio sp.]HWR03951.1 histidinol dehydrogenase [Humidesulfovibrio sp.]